MKLNRMTPEERETLESGGTWVLTIQKRRYKTLKLARWVHSNPPEVGGGGMVSHWAFENLTLFSENVLKYTLDFITLLRTKDKMRAVLF